MCCIGPSWRWRCLRERRRSSWLDPLRDRTMFTRIDESAGIAGPARSSSNQVRSMDRRLSLIAGVLVGLAVIGLLLLIL